MLTLFTLASAVLAAEPDSAPQVLMADGSTLAGTLVSAGANGKLEFMAADGLRTVPADDLVLWGGFVEPTRGAQIFMPGGGLIVASAPVIEKDRLNGSNEWLGDVRLPLESVAAIVFRQPAGSRARDALAQRIAEPTGLSDRVLLDNGDEISGTILSLDTRNLSLQAEAGPVEIAVRRLAAVIFNPSLVVRPTADKRTTVGLRDGSRLIAARLMSSEKAKLDLPDGTTLSAPISAIVALQPMGGRVDYLSDLEPLGYRHIPFLELSWPYHVDRNVTGGPLRAGGKLYLKGLGMHSPSRIAYDLPERCEQFQAEAAIDQSAGDGGSAIFRVFVDDADGWKEVAASEIVRGGDSPVPLRADIRGAKRLSLLVDYADRGDELDHADWQNARVVRGPDSEPSK